MPIVSQRRGRPKRYRTCPRSAWPTRLHAGSANNAPPSGSIRYAPSNAPLAAGQVSAQIVYNPINGAVPINGQVSAPQLNHQLSFPPATAAAANGSLRYGSPGYSN